MNIRLGRVRQDDLSLARRTIKDLLGYTHVIADLSSIGFKTLKGVLLTPIKKPKKLDLAKLGKQVNRKISRRQIVIEHINQKLKSFRILSERYRNRRKRFGLRANLIADIVN